MALRPVSVPAHSNVRVTRSALTATPAAVRHHKPENVWGHATPPGGFTPSGLGSFNVKDLGAGSVTVGPAVKTLPNGKVERTVEFYVNADAFKKEPAVTSAKLVLLKPNNGGRVEVKMTLGKKAAEGWNRMAVGVNQDDLNALRGNATSLEFMFELKLRNGKTVPVNQHGVPFQNFGLHKDQMKTR